MPSTPTTVTAPKSHAQFHSRAYPAGLAGNCRHPSSRPTGSITAAICTSSWVSTPTATSAATFTALCICLSSSGSWHPHDETQDRTGTGRCRHRLLRGHSARPAHAGCEVMELPADRSSSRRAAIQPTGSDREPTTPRSVSLFNRRRLLEPIGDIPPAEYETLYYRHPTPARQAEPTTPLHLNPGRFTTASLARQGQVACPSGVR